MKQWRKVIALWLILLVVVSIPSVQYIREYMLDKQYYTSIYKQSVSQSVREYNDVAFKYLVMNYGTKNVLISPLCVERTIADNLPTQDDTLFEKYKNGVVNFENSTNLIPSDCFYMFSAGKDDVFTVDIEGSVLDSFILDEINARLNTATGGKTRSTVGDWNTQVYNLYAVVSLQGTPVGLIEDFDENSFVVTGNYRYMETEDFNYVEIPLKGDNYTLCLLRVQNKDTFSFSSANPFYLKSKDYTLRLRKFNEQFIGSPRAELKTFGLDSLFTEYPQLDGLYCVNCFSLDVDYDSYSTAKEYAYDFSSDCIYSIRDNNSGYFVMIGNLIGF